MIEEIEFTHSPTIGAIAKALAAFQAKAPTIAKNKTASIRSDKGSYSYNYADLGDILPAAYPILAENGLAFTSPPAHGRLVGLLIHESGEWFRGELQLPGSGTMQQLGSAITYCRRYLFGCLTGIVTDADDDGQAASKARPAKKSAARPPQQPGRAASTEPVETGELRTDAQSRHMFALLNEAGLGDRAAAQARIAQIIGHDIETTKDLTKAEAHKVIEALKSDKSQESYGGQDPWGER